MEKVEFPTGPDSWGGLGEKVVPKMDCLVCYKQRCDFVPNCMDLIGVDRVALAPALLATP
jgi:hypothetical protein